MHELPHLWIVLFCVNLQESLWKLIRDFMDRFFKHCFLHYSSIVRTARKYKMKCILLMHLHASEKTVHTLEFLPEKSPIK